MLAQFFKSIPPPSWIRNYNPGGCGEGFIVFLTNLLRLGIVLAAIYALINLMLAGFQYLTAAGDAKAVGQAGEKITHTLIGLIIVAGSFVLAAVFSILIFGDASVILNPVIYGPPSVSCP